LLSTGETIVNEERMQILQMLQEGKISVDEAAQLIDTLSNRAGTATTVPVINEPAVQPAVAAPAVRSAGSQAKGNWSIKNVFASSLGNTIFEGTKLDGGRIWCCNLERANLRNADFTSAWVLGNNLDSANFEGANLNNVKLIGCNLDHADFTGADLHDSVIIGVNFDRGDYRGADLSGRTLIGLNLEGQKLAAPAVPATNKE
jgi:uncharacterized protein YjbI with pentapeptide repeats